ncbi:MAG: DUF4229 domain-containing protein [Streptosporangiaceae bacterium]
MRSVLAYSSARILLFVATVAILFLCGARGPLLLALSVLISGIVSYVLLSRQRDEVSAVLTEKAQRGKARLDESKTKED